MAGAARVPGFDAYLTVGEAATRLGVSPWTLRLWDRKGKLRSVRHPLNGYRLYRPEDLETLLASVAEQTSWPRAKGGGR